MTPSDEDLQEVRAGLAANADNLALSLLGEPTSRTGAEWRWGRAGSFSMVMRGRKRGLWHDHEAGTGGDLLALIQRDRASSFPAALDYAHTYLRMPVADRPRPRIVEPAAAQAEDDDTARIARARRFAADGVQVDGTPAEAYLIQVRGITKPEGGWPDAVRFHPQRSALMMLATDAAGEVRAVQLVHLTTEGGKLPGEPGRPTKQSYGMVSGAAVRLPGRAVPLLLAEGPETGLSVWAASGIETWVALGSMAKLDPPATRRLVVCADDDKPDAPAAKALGKAVSRWRGERRNVAVALPWAERRFDKSDFNDLLRAAGAEAVRSRIMAALSPPRPGGRTPLVPVKAARGRLQAAVSNFFQQARAFDPDAENGPAPIVHGIRVGVGVGKSDGARREAAKMLAEMRARGDNRTIVIAVPTHKLGDEQARDFEALQEARAHGLRAAVWRGREAVDPADAGATMCRDLEAVRDAQSIGVKAETSVCFQRGGGVTPIMCPFYGMCGYQRQKQVEADLWIVPHEMIFTEKPAAIGRVAVVIVDEAAWQDGLQGVNGPPEDMSVHALATVVDVLPGDNTGHFTARLREVYRVVGEALAGLPDGPLCRDAMRQHGIDRNTATEGRALTWRRRIDPGLLPGMPAAERRAMVRAVAENRTVIRLAKFFTALEALMADDGPEASGWAALVTVPTDDGPVRMLRLRGRRKLRTGWTVPTLILDALLDARLVAPYWPQVQVTAEIEAATPHMRVRQIVGRDFSKASMVPDAWRANTEAEIARRHRNSVHVRAAVLREARAVSGRTLAVAQKAVEDQWRETGAALPSCLDLAHHNAVAGRDEWGPGPGRDGVAQILVIGRTLPRPGDVERMTEALTGQAVTARVQRYTKHEAPIEMRDGSIVAGEAYRHPDPIAEAIRWQICEGEVVQIIGRGRGVNRTGDNPLSVLILTDTPLPLPVDELVTWDSLAPSPADLMLSAGGVVLADAADAARAYPALWPSPAAARQAIHRARCVTNPHRELPKGECHAPLPRATYQRAGAGCRPAVAIFDPEAVPDLKAWLVERIGHLAACDAPKASCPKTRMRTRAREEVPLPEVAPIMALHPPLPGEAIGAPAGRPLQSGPLGVVDAPLAPIGRGPEPGSTEPEDDEPVDAPAAWQAELARRLAARPKPRMWGDATDAVKLMFWREWAEAIVAEWDADWRAAWAAGRKLPAVGDGTA